MGRSRLGVMGPQYRSQLTGSIDVNYDGPAASGYQPPEQRIRPRFQRDFARVRQRELGVEMLKRRAIMFGGGLVLALVLLACNGGDEESTSSLPAAAESATTMPVAIEPNQETAVTLPAPTPTAPPEPAPLPEPVIEAVPEVPLPDELELDVRNVRVLDATVSVVFRQTDDTSRTTELTFTYPVRYLGSVLAQNGNDAVTLTRVEGVPLVELSVPPGNIAVVPALDARVDLSTTQSPTQLAVIDPDGSIASVTSDWRHPTVLFMAEGGLFIPQDMQRLLASAALSSSECLLKAKQALRTRVLEGMQNWYVEQGFGPEIVRMRPVTDTDSAQPFAVPDGMHQAITLASPFLWQDIEVTAVSC